MAEDALRRLSDRDSRLLAIRSAGYAVSLYRNEEQILEACTMIESLRLLDRDAGLDHHELSNALLRALVTQGRFDLANSVAKARNVSRPIALLVAQGDLPTALAAYRESAGLNDVDRAVAIAVSLSRAGHPDNAIEFLQAAQPERKREWAVTLSLELACHGQMATETAKLAGNDLRKSVLIHACDELAQWDVVYRKALEHVEVSQAATHLVGSDIVGLARIVAACNVQRLPLPTDVQTRIRAPARPSPMVLADAQQLHTQYQHLMQELMYYRVINNEQLLLDGDRDNAREITGDREFLRAAQHVGARLRREKGTAGALVSLSKVSNGDVATVAQLGVLRADVGLPISSSPLSDDLRERRKRRIIGILMDPLFD